MQPLRIPRLYCPILARINPLEEQSTVHTINWIKKFNLHSGPALEKFIGDNFGKMTARFYPTADQLRLNLANDVNSLLFVMDDDMDHQTEKADLILSRQNYITFVDKCMDILRLADAYLLDSPTGVFAALHDVWKRLRAISTPQWQAGFIESIGKMFEAGFWEYENVQQGILPSVKDFYNLRPFLGAAHISTDLICVIENIDIPESILKYENVLEATLLARKIVCWANDLFSYSKEADHGDMHNMISIIMTESKVSLEQAILRTVSIHNQDMDKFISISNELPSFGNYDSQLRHYIMVLGAILRGNIDWSAGETTRYDFIYG
jgi:hypothetical protein